MKLEGKMVGVWVEECRMAWLALAPSLLSKRLFLDLRGVTFVDAFGLQLLRDIYTATCAEMVTDSPLTRHFAELAVQQEKKNGWKGV